MNSSDSPVSLPQPDATCVYAPAFGASVGIIRLLRHGTYDPSVKLRGSIAWRAVAYGTKTATIRYRQLRDGVAVDAWGEGAEFAVEEAPRVLGGSDSLDGWNPGLHPLVEEMNRQHPRLRFPATGKVWEALLPSVLEQRVTAAQALTSWRKACSRWGAPAPLGMTLCPDPALVARIDYTQWHRLGVERNRADTLRGVASRVFRAEEAATLPTEERRPRLEAFQGIGRWTSALVASVAWADADAPLEFDWHVPGLVTFALTGKRGGTNDDMLELLEPFRPHRGRAAQLILRSGIAPQRRTNKWATTDITGI